METDRRIKRAIIALQLSQPFFGFLAMNITLHESKQCPTVGIDHNFNMYYNKEWIDKNITDDNLMLGVVAHETLHPALDHLGRLGHRLPIISNIAQDMVVCMIVKSSGMTAIEGEHYVNVDIGSDTAWFIIPYKNIGKIEIKKVSEKPWETIYEEIMKKLGKDAEEVEEMIKGKKIIIILDEHFHKEFDKLTDAEKSIIREKMKEILVEATIVGKQAGKLPGTMERYVKELLEPKIPWQSVVFRHVKPYVDPKDWTYSRPNRKSYQYGIFLPRIKGTRVVIDTLVDTSGSIDIESYTEFVSEINGMMKAFSSALIYISYGDTKINTEYVLNSTEFNKLLTLVPKGGGGTDMEHCLDEIKKKDRKTEIVIVLTDGETYCNKKEKDYPFEVIWVICKKGIKKDRAEKHFSYGRVLKM